MSSTLPEHIDPWKLARRGEHLTGQLRLAGLDRLADAVHGVGQQVEISWHFDLDSRNRPTITGELHAEVRMVCQRCLEPLTVVLEAPQHLVLVSSGEEEPDLESPWEALEVPATGLMLAELVEDELLLALPVAPRHEACSRNQYRDEAREPEEPAQENPFAVLQALKQK